MKTLWSPNVWSGFEWLGPTRIVIDSDGCIAELERNTTSEKADDNVDILLPGFQNCHSHIFQYLMVGMLEESNADTDNFWTWRETMYRLAWSLDPEQVYATAKMFFAESLIHGFTHHVEFHYLHRDRQGKAYSQENIMAEAIIKAAGEIGIDLTMIPVFYHRGNFNQPLAKHQMRFETGDVDNYSRLLSSIAQLKTKYNFELGHGVHSLRAANNEECKTILASALTEGPRHIHIAEQTKEVNDFEQLYKLRPVEWLIDHCQHPINLVHSTHMSSDETIRLAQSQHNVVLCPTTEGNLGDGIFPLTEFHQRGGNWCIGTDSHINLSPLWELALADYSQRFVLQERNPLLPKQGGNSAKEILTRIHHGSTLASGIQGGISQGQPFRAIEIDSNHPNLTQKKADHCLAGILFSGDQRLIKATYVGTSKEVANGRHSRQEDIRMEFANTQRSIQKSLDEGLDR